jgi:hypothetical protein
MLSIREDDLRDLLKRAWEDGFYANRNAGDIEDYEDGKKFSIQVLMIKAGQLNG